MYLKLDYMHVPKHKFGIFRTVLIPSFCMVLGGVFRLCLSLSPGPLPWTQGGGGLFHSLLLPGIKVSSDPKNGGINKWRFFIDASNIHPQISLILLNAVSSYNLHRIGVQLRLRTKLSSACMAIISTSWEQEAHRQYHSPEKQFKSISIFEQSYG